MFDVAPNVVLTGSASITDSEGNSRPVGSIVPKLKCIVEAACGNPGMKHIIFISDKQKLVEKPRSGKEDPSGKRNSIHTLRTKHLQPAQIGARFNWKYIQSFCQEKGNSAIVPCGNVFDALCYLCNNNYLSGANLPKLQELCARYTRNKEYLDNALQLRFIDSYNMSYLKRMFDICNPPETDGSQSKSRIKYFLNNMVTLGHKIAILLSCSKREHAITDSERTVITWAQKNPMCIMQIQNL